MKNSFSKNRKTNNSKKLKIHIKFNNDISKDEEDRIWSQFFDIIDLFDNKHKTQSKDAQSTNDKEGALKTLNKSLNSPKELGGMFLPPDLPKRFDIMFIAEMPSMNEPQKDSPQISNFNFGVTARDKFFQEMLIKYGVAGSYITDIVKERNVPRRPTKEEVKKWLPFLLKEIEIVKPKAIIVLGKRTYEASFKSFVEPLIPKGVFIDYVFHYSSQVPRNKFEKRFSEVIKCYTAQTAYSVSHL